MIVDMKPTAYVLIQCLARIKSQRTECNAQWIPVQGAVEESLLSIDSVNVFDGELNVNIVSDREFLRRFIIYHNSESDKGAECCVWDNHLLR